jgi:hypothetical protein
VGTCHESPTAPSSVTVEDADLYDEDFGGFGLEAEKSYPARFDGKRHPARRGEVREATPAQETRAPEGLDAAVRAAP